MTGKLREQILAIRAFWESWQHGSKLNFRGDYYKLTLMSPFFDPGPIANPRIPIFIAGVNAGLARSAGEICDGFVVHPLHSPRYLKETILPAVVSGAKRAGRQRQDISVSVTAFVATTAVQRELARSQLAFYASTPSYRSVLDLHGWGGVAEKLSAHAARAGWDSMPVLVSDEMLDGFCLTASEANLPAALGRYHGLAARLRLSSPYVPGERDSLWRRLADTSAAVGN